MSSSKIIKLSPKLISQIAAGEVVERPTNLVKELIENSIDANALKITIQIENGGLDRVIVQDNGDGMSSQDLLLAFELHTTSKLLDNEISKVATLGFRGEALASISAVSRVKCTSCLSNEMQGYMITIEGGKLLSQTTINASRGTSIEISGLFFNTPARRKFLKKPSTERKRIIDLITHYTLSYPKIHFVLDEIENTKQRRRLESPPRKSVLAVIYDVLGHEIASDLIPLKGKISNWFINGYISKPNLTRSDRSLQYLCINGRAIRHAILQNAIESSYGSQLMRSAHPILILELVGSPDAVDFNMHPQKSEIRFRSSDPVINEISLLVQQTLMESSELPLLQLSKFNKVPEIAHTLVNSNVKSSHQLEELDPFEVLLSNKKEKIKKPKFIQEQLDGKKTFTFAGKRVLGQVMLKFGLVESDDELWLIDIHAADERVKFEKYEKGYARKALSQQFLEPMTIELLPSDKQILLDHATELAKFGLNTSNAAGNFLLIHSCPVYYDQEITPITTKKLLEEIASFLQNTNDVSISSITPFSKIEYGIVARLACHGSIRSGVLVSHQTISKVIEELLHCKNPWTCAHGRPTILRIPRTRLENWFNR